MNENLRRIEKIASALSEMNDDVIFIGGACSQFYVDKPEIFDFRPTKDVDLIVKVYSYTEYISLGEKLMKLGFSYDTSKGAPIVRRIFDGILVDIIPDDASIVDYREIKWFKEGRKHKKVVELPSGNEINILSMPYYIATKLEAWLDRGKGDYLSNHDIEDIVNIIEGNENLNELKNSEESVKYFLLESFKKMSSDIDFVRSIQGHLGFDSVAEEKAKLVKDKIKVFINLG